MQLSSENATENYWLVYFIDGKPFYGFNFEKPVSLTTKLKCEEAMLQDEKFSSCYERVTTDIMNDEEFEKFSEENNYSINGEDL